MFRLSPLCLFFLLVSIATLSQRTSALPQASDLVNQFNSSDFDSSLNALDRCLNAHKHQPTTTLSASIPTGTPNPSESDPNGNCPGASYCNLIRFDSLRPSPTDLAANPLDIFVFNPDKNLTLHVDYRPIINIVYNNYQGRFAHLSIQTCRLNTTHLVSRPTLSCDAAADAAHFDSLYTATNITAGTNVVRITFNDLQAVSQFESTPPTGDEIFSYTINNPDLSLLTFWNNAFAIWFT